MLFAGMVALAGAAVVEGGGGHGDGGLKRSGCNGNHPPNSAKKSQQFGRTIRRAYFAAKCFPVTRIMALAPQTHCPFGCCVVRDTHRFSLWRFFFHVHGKAVHFLNIQKAPIASTTFWKNDTVFGRGHPEKWQTHRFSLWRFFFHVHGKSVHFLNIQKAPIASTRCLDAKA